MGTELTPVDADKQRQDADRQVELFFQLMAGVYGREKMHREWPTEEDVQIRNALWRDDILKYSPIDLRGAIDNARKQQQNGVESFLWPNVGLILSGCQRHINASHKPIQKPEKHNRDDELARRKLDELHAMFK